MQTLEHDQLSSVWGGNELELPGGGDDFGRSDDGQTTGRCGLGPYSFGYTKECKAHDDCVEGASKWVGRPGADLLCLPKLPAAAASAAKCAVDPNCPK